MPSHEGVVDEAQLAALLDDLESLPPPQTAAASGTAVDPVCYMKVAVVDVTARLQRGGKTFYFCSSACRARFSNDPDRYRDAAPR
jgi:YHS domain-containing protein